MQSVKKLVKKLIPASIFYVLVLPYHWALAVAAAVQNGFPGKKMRVIGVTGTNGKTTTANMIATLLEHAGEKVGILSSAVTQIGDERIEQQLDLTTPDPFTLNRQLKKMAEAGTTFAVIEVSSHALSQHRVYGVPFEGAVWTNLTQDHLDYHKTMERYAAAKRKLLKKAQKFVVLNHDDEWFEFMNVKHRLNTITYGTHEDADIKIVNAKLTAKGSHVRVQTHEERFDLELNIPGKFNVYNALAAAGVGLELKLATEVIQKGLASIEAVPGRMERIDEGQSFTVIVDHAHTPDALENLLDNVKRMTRAKLHVVVGADGERDPGKRVPIGATVAKFADHIIVTDQEPYGDDPDPIRAQVIEGVQSADFENVEDIADRKAAFKAVFKAAKPGDTVVLTGLGNQKYRGMKEGKVEWDDRDVARGVLKELRKKK